MSRRSVLQFFQKPQEAHENPAIYSVKMSGHHLLRKGYEGDRRLLFNLFDVSEVDEIPILLTQLFEDNSLVCSELC
jgi:hypothetical protein